MNVRQVVPRLIIFVSLTATIFWVAVNRDQLDFATIDTWLAGLGIVAPLAYLALYSVGTIAFLPGAIFALAGGALFGPIWGSLLNLVGATIGASLAFIIARYIAGEWVTARTGGRLKQLIEGVEAEGWRFVAFVRLVPVFPFNLINYALGLTRINFWSYVITSLLAMAPGAIAYTWLGHAGREAFNGNASAIRYGLLALGLIAAIALLPRLVRRIRSIKHQRVDADTLTNRFRKGDVTVIDVRGTDEFEGEIGHIASALNLPLDELPERLTEIRSLRDLPVILVCQTDKRSVAAATLLSNAGFCDVSILQGGMDQWNRNGNPVEFGSRKRIGKNRCLNADHQRHRP